ncbi:MAG: hypothetical protein GXX91_17475 [Verrucomicrobiaceae bacterium]|nr:hypothetical protein [Verrucomicrobiaceae bacterium]
MPALSSPLYLIDAIGPFFPGYDRFRINWSKLPWMRFQDMSPEELREAFVRVRADMETFCRGVARIGYNGVTLDDVPHLALHEFYEDTVKERIALYREEFRKLFAVIRAEGLHLYLTMDILTLTPQLESRLGNNERKQRQFLAELLDRFFLDFPEVAGVVLRIGESDGLDIKETFRSKLVLKSPAMVNRCLQAILPVFEHHQRRCIFRTWTVGAHEVGDLIWREATLEKTVAGLSSPALVLSMKYGESDFFRYLSLNRNFFVTDIPKIVELQSRREYEGCGEYPSFVGGDYEQFAIELREAPNVVGISVWCQTGGWTPFRRLAFLDPAAVWTEINTFVTLRLFKHGELVEEALSHLPEVTETPNPTALGELLRLSEEVVTELLYLPDFARQRFYFRRVRIPPLLGVYWHHIFVAHSLKKMLDHLVSDGEETVRAGHAAMAKIKRMRTLALQCHLPEEDIEYMEYTLGIIALGREYFFRPDEEGIRKRLEKAKKKYKKRYPRGSRYRYTVKLDFKPFRLNARYISLFFNHLVRRKPAYRFIDKIIGLRLLSIAYFVLKRSRPKRIPKIARKSAMGIDAIFK